MANESREDLKDYCLRKLGSPVINIEIDEVQMEDRIDDALQKFNEFHYDGTEQNWVYYEVTATDAANGYITVPDNLLTINKMIDVGQLFNSSRDMFSPQYQFMINSMSPWKVFDQVSYFLTVTNYETFNSLVNAQPRIEFTRHMNKLNIYDGELCEGSRLGFHAHIIIDPEIHTRVYDDLWLKAYTTALFKLQWASNVSKYDGVVLLGNMTINAEKLYTDALAEIEKLEDELKNVYSEPVPFIFG